MKIKALIGSLITVTCLAFVACDDDLNTVGSGIRPDSDSIFVGIDSVTLKAATVSLNNSVHARADMGLLGEYNDEMFGNVKSDYLCEFYSSEDTKFFDKTFAIDSVRVYVVSSSFMGDRSKLMGLKAYAVNKPLKENLFTDIEPKDYADLGKTLAQGAFIFKDAPRVGDANSPEAYRRLTLNADTIIGRNFINEWKTNPKTFTDQTKYGADKKTKFQSFFPGMYITSTFGEGTLMNVQATVLGIYYKYKGRNIADTADSIRVSSLEIDVSPRVVQMNRVKNTIDPSILGPSDVMTYIKSPAGLYTELTIPLKDILTIVGKDRTINSAAFNLMGFTEEEEKSAYKAPKHLLFINKDSIDTFFSDKRLDDHISSFVMNRDTTYNYYYFANDNGNINKMIDHYKEQYEKKGTAIENIPDLKYVLMPIERLTTQSTAISTAIYNLMEPKSALIRTDKKHMQLRLVFSKYESINKKSQ